MALQEELEKQGVWLFRYRGVLPMVILGIGAILYLRSQFYPHLYFLQNVRYEFYFEMLCLAISLGGLAVRIYTVGNTPKNTSGRNVKEQVADELNTFHCKTSFVFRQFFYLARPSNTNRTFLVCYCFLFILLGLLRKNYVCRRAISAKKIWH